eukprot:m.34957 g.34957  ORF g.34957 m.34957 type:complete len:90 (+) comp11223_c0_seq1:36-305(+)
MDTTERLKAGFAMGATIGLSVGAMFSSVMNFRAGLRGRHLLRGTAQNTLLSGLMFGMVLAIGMVVRAEERAPTPAITANPSSRQVRKDL